MKKKEKKAAIELSFSMIFSIILIIVFVVAAIFGLKMILERANQAKVASEVLNFQNKITKLWYDYPDASITYKLNFPSKIKYVCFVNWSGRGLDRVSGDPPPREREKIKEEVGRFNYKKPNLVLWPPDATYGAPWYYNLMCDNKFNCIALRFVRENKAYCFKNKNIKVKLIKELGTKEVIIDKWLER